MKLIYLQIQFSTRGDYVLISFQKHEWPLCAAHRALSCITPKTRVVTLKDVYNLFQRKKNGAKIVVIG